ncbi:hypothetical protein B0H14DRAFT_2591170 [Mycena olivaceomarginata]|nr:hypothetical protein B0H14DRAFT_2591170 [Mycena olivaceomarginata]
MSDLWKKAQRGFSEVAMVGNLGFEGAEVTIAVTVRVDAKLKRDKNESGAQLLVLERQREMSENSARATRGQNFCRNRYPTKTQTGIICRSLFIPPNARMASRPRKRKPYTARPHHSLLTGPAEFKWTIRDAVGKVLAIEQHLENIRRSPHMDGGQDLSLTFMDGVRVSELVGVVRYNGNCDPNAETAKHILSDAQRSDPISSAPSVFDQLNQRRSAPI